MSQPNVLVLGGVGFIGRNLVTYLVENNLAKHVRVVDKVLPSTAFLGNPHAAAFENSIVEYKQCNLTSDAGVAKAFTMEEGKFELVFNLAAETKYGQTEEVYAEKVLTLSKKVAAAAAKFGANKYIEASTAQVYSEGKKASKEESKISPWTNLAKYKLQAENAVKEIDGLPWIIVRPSTVYGPGDVSGLSPRIICGAVYKHLHETMKFLWSGDLRINTVHVRDVCAALWHVSQNAQVKTTWNLSDKGDTTQKKVNKMLEQIFGIKTGFLGAAISSIAKLKLKDVTEEINDKHLKPWADLCRDAEILNTPLTPYIDQELLYNNSLSIDGAAIESTGFSYSVPEVTVDLLKEQIDYYVQQNLFPST